MTELGNAAAKASDRDKIVKIINSVVQKVEQAETVSREAIYHELAEVKKIIDEARAEVGLARPSDISDKHIPTATDELDAVIAATAEATGSIMDACEAIESKAAEIGGDSANALTNEVTKIYEACSFQDITGQRISKVVKTLQEIEDKVARLMSVMDHKIPGNPGAAPATAPAVEAADPNDESSLLNGPAMPGGGISQEEIDKLLADFD